MNRKEETNENWTSSKFKTPFPKPALSTEREGGPCRPGSPGHGPLQRTAGLTTGVQGTFWGDSNSSQSMAVVVTGLHTTIRTH